MIRIPPCLQLESRFPSDCAIDGSIIIQAKRRVSYTDPANNQVVFGAQNELIDFMQEMLDAGHFGPGEDVGTFTNEVDLTFFSSFINSSVYRDKNPLTFRPFTRIDYSSSLVNGEIVWELELEIRERPVFAASANGNLICLVKFNSTAGQTGYSFQQHPPLHRYCGRPARSQNYSA